MMGWDGGLTELRAELVERLHSSNPASYRELSIDMVILEMPSGRRCYRGGSGFNIWVNHVGVVILEDHARQERFSPEDYYRLQVALPPKEGGSRMLYREEGQAE